MSNEQLTYLALGGAGEIGMNAYVYGYGAEGKERFILVDLGVTFPDMDGSPGVDLIMADIAWLEERKDRLDGIFITHAHEDHIGAIGLLYDRLNAPVYARAFTAHLARMKLTDRGKTDDAVQTVSAWPETINAGPFSVGIAPISHSIPESSALVIDTPAGRIVHTGDFKVDETPGVGEPFDEAMWREIAKDGVEALVCDSTNVFSPVAGRSEATLPEPIAALISGAEGMVAATTFASNIARVKTLAEAGRKAGRSVVLLGRAMRKMISAGVETGILSDFPKTVSPEDALSIPRENLMLLSTGSQGERLAATAQLARGKYLGLEMKEGDMFLFSSKTIPGNEVSVGRIVNAFSEKGVDVIDDSSGLYHVSGHANRPDLSLMHKLISPTIVVPMHGEHRHLRAHCKLAEENGFAAALAPNGTRISLKGERAEVVEHVETGRLYLDGKVMIGALDGIVRNRIRMALNGHISVSLVLDDNELLGDAWCELRGLPEVGISRAPLVELLEHDITSLLERSDRKTMRDDDKIEEAVRRVARKVAQDEIGKKPEIDVIVSRMH